MNRCIIKYKRRIVSKNQRILASTKNNLGPLASNLTYQVIPNADGISSIQWLGTSHLSVPSLLRPSTVLSAERQAILKALQASSIPLSPKQLTAQTGQHHTLVRQILRRMLFAGEILSPTYGLYTLRHYPSPAAPSENNAVTSATSTTPTTPATPATVSHLDSNFAVPAALTTPATSTTVSHLDSNFAVPITPTTPATVSHTDSNFDPPPDVPTPPTPTNEASSTPQSTFQITIEKLSLLLHCSYTAHYLFWIFSPQKIGCPSCDNWLTGDAALNPATAALYTAISQYPPYETPSRAAWIELIAPSLANE